VDAANAAAEPFVHLAQPLATKPSPRPFRVRERQQQHACALSQIPKPFEMPLLTKRQQDGAQSFEPRRDEELPQRLQGVGQPRDFVAGRQTRKKRFAGSTLFSLGRWGSRGSFKRREELRSSDPQLPYTTPAGNLTLTDPNDLIE
jgi:hypothetical protein